jgi:hypothetical protein
MQLFNFHFVEKKEGWYLARAYLWPTAVEPGE